MTNNAIPLQSIFCGQNDQISMLSQNIFWINSTLGMSIQM